VSSFETWAIKNPDSLTSPKTWILKTEWPWSPTYDVLKRSYEVLMGLQMLNWLSDWLLTSQLKKPEFARRRRIKHHTRYGYNIENHDLYSMPRTVRHSLHVERLYGNWVTASYSSKVLVHRLWPY
jgi:hypothetical protein